jgi:hypothetical protein
MKQVTDLMGYVGGASCLPRAAGACGSELARDRRQQAASHKQVVPVGASLLATLFSQLDSKCTTPLAER